MNTYKQQWCPEKKRAIYTHRVLWEKANGPIPTGLEIDHINGDREDNRLDNLRLVTRQENTKNVRLRDSNTCGVTGVGWFTRRSKWRSRIESDGKAIHLGYFDDWFDAVCARMSANNRYGFHPNHGRR